MLALITFIFVGLVSFFLSRDSQTGGRESIFFSFKFCLRCSLWYKRRETGTRFQDPESFYTEEAALQVHLDKEIRADRRTDMQTTKLL